MSKKEKDKPEFLARRIKILEKQLGVSPIIEYNSYWEISGTDKYLFRYKCPDVSLLEKVDALLDFVGIGKIYKKYTAAKTEVIVEKKKTKKQCK